MRKLLFKIWFASKSRFSKDGLTVNGWTKKQAENIQRHIIKILSPAKEDNIFEFGCGTGLNLNALSNICTKITGADHLKGMVARAQKNNRKKPNVEVVHYIPPRLPFEDNSFNKVFSWSVFEYLANKTEAEQLLRELYRITRPDGLILIGDLPSTAGKNSILRDFSIKDSHSVVDYPFKLLGRFLYLYFDPYILKAFCEQHFGESEIIDQSELLPHYYGRFDILIKAAK